MGKHERPDNVEVTKALLELGSAALHHPDVISAVEKLHEALSQNFTGAEEIAAMTVLAGSFGCANAIEGHEQEALDAQLNKLRSIHATHQLHERTVH